MKKRLLVLAGLFVLFTAGVFGQAFGDDTGMFVKIDNYEFSVPSFWTVQKCSGFPIFYITAPQDEDSNFQVNANMGKEVLPGKYSVKSYMEAVRKNLDTLGIISELQEEGDDYHIIRSFISGLDVTQIQYVKIIGNVAHVITFTSLSDDFDDYLETFKAIYSTLKIKK